jgi:hypothetical protein
MSQNAPGCAWSPSDKPTAHARRAGDCVAAIRNKLIGNLVSRAAAARTSEVAASVGMVTKTAHQHLEDLSLLGLADRTKTSAADNAPDLWSASDWLRKFWPNPESEREMCVRTGSGFKEETDVDTNTAHPDTPSGTSRSHFGEPAINTADAGTSLLSYVGLQNLVKIWEVMRKRMTG